MVFDPVSQILLDQICKETLKQDEKGRKSGYWMLCPSCGKRVVKKELIKKGCYLCGWKGTKEEIKTAQIKQLSQSEQVKSLVKKRKIPIHTEQLVLNAEERL